MSYTVLALKWRPRRFEQLVGQPHVVQALANSLKQNRLHHAYLFTGTRGVGKTTVARSAGESVELRHGHRGGAVRRVRRLHRDRRRAVRGPDRGRRCVAHARGRHARACSTTSSTRPRAVASRCTSSTRCTCCRIIPSMRCLKTLEEPPPHVKFLLATTDPQKLPVTVLSRCLQFNLKRFTAAQIQAQLEKICAAEGIPADRGRAEGRRARRRWQHARRVEPARPGHRVRRRQGRWPADGHDARQHRSRSRVGS